MNENSRKGGYLKAIIIIIIALVILSYFGLDLSRLFTASGPQNLLDSAVNLAKWVWMEFLVYFNMLLAYLKSIQH